MSSDIEVAAKLRDAKGSNQVRKIRQEGWIPAVVYSSIQETTPIQINEHDFELMLSRHGSESMMMGLQIDGGEYTQVLLKEVQHHPVDGHILHVDFHAVAMDKKLVVHIPVELAGDSRGLWKAVFSTIFCASWKSSVCRPILWSSSGSMFPISRSATA